MYSGLREHDCDAGGTTGFRSSGRRASSIDHTPVGHGSRAWSLVALERNESHAVPAALLGRGEVHPRHTPLRIAQELQEHDEGDAGTQLERT
jgi:hypothetical protein